jgi:DNA-binding NtrC family response regulator
MERVLLIDDNVAFLRDVEALLGSRYATVTASSGKRGLEILESEPVAAVLLDLKMPEMQGLEVLAKIRAQIDPHLPVIIVTDQGEVDMAVKAMQLGAYDFIPKSFDLDLLTAKIVKALERRSLEISVDALQRSQAEQYDRLLFASESMKLVNYQVSNLAQRDFDVLIIGETGVGKDLVAFELHRRGSRRDYPFIPVPMKTLNETLIESELFGHEKGAFSGAERTKIGKLEAAKGGTVYIPEVSSLTETIQLKLLQFMQYKTIARVGQDPRRPPAKLDVRIILATNESLEEVVQAGRMREDFYHRITGVQLHIPPLRERLDDLQPLALSFIKKYATGGERAGYELAPEVLETMRVHRWPGNVRELENMIKNAIAYSSDKTLRLVDFPKLSGVAARPSQCRACLAAQGPHLPTYAEIEATFRRAYFEEVLKRTGGNIQKAAMTAGLTPQGLRKILKALTPVRE